MNLWLLMFLIGVGTYLLRFSFIALYGRLHLSPNLERALKYVPPAVLAALVAPAILNHGGRLDLSLGNPRPIAALVAILVSLRFKNIFWSITAGMVTLWVLGALFS